MYDFVRTFCAATILAAASCFSIGLQAANTDPNPAWPLCGRITENPPPGWVDTDGCPADRFGNPAHSDAPFSATYGPRPLASESNRYDFHRGVDIATPIGTPFFAIADGVVQNAGPHPSYSDPMVSVRHFRPGETSCNAGGCYTSLNLHVSGWVVAADDAVVKGQLLGYTGESGSGFDHLHFELRDAPDFDPFSSWQRDAIHPFEVMPYSVANNTSIVFNNVDFSNPSAGIVDVTVTSNRFDLVSVDVDLQDASQLPIPQPGDTPNANGYLVEPSSFDMQTWNFQYSHKNSTGYPWSSFGAGGANECPYHADHGGSYSAHVHMDQQVPGSPLEGQFNGVHVQTQKYWPSDVDDYEVRLEFYALQGNPDCVQVTALFASGDTETAEFGTCGAVSAAQVTRGPYLQMQTDDGISIRWRTDVATDSVVRYGTSAGNLNQAATVGGSRTEHEVTLSGLGPNQQFWYSVGDSISPIAGDASYHFHTAPVLGNPADTRVWVLGDSGTANQDARDVRDAYKTFAASDPADIWLMLGDNAYNDGTDAEYQAAVFDTYPEVLRQLPLWSTLGNHDGHTADSGTQTGPYYDIFSLPANGEIGGLSSGTEAYYSFDYANIHFICLDSYDTDRSTSGSMLTWLESDLATNTQPWVIAFWHHPPYTKGSHDSDTEGRLIDMRQNALPILEAWGVDLVMTGHSHSFERSYLIDGHYGASGTLDPVSHVLNPGDGWELGDGVYEKPDVVAAQNAGAVYAVAGSSGKISGGSLDHPAMFLSISELGSLVIDVSGNRMDVTFIDETAAVQDIFTIEKTPDNDPPLLTSASAETATQVLVDFNENLDPVTAANAGNYAITGLIVSNAELLAGDRQVRLTTSPMTPEASYVLTVNNVEDVNGNVIAPDSQVGFDYFEFVTVAFQDGLMPDPGYFGNHDAYIREASPDTQHGTETTLQVDGSEPSGSETDMSIVIKWETDSIPTDAIVENAHVVLEVTNVSSGTYECYALLADWNQAEVTWNEASSGSGWGAPGASSGLDRGSDVVCSVVASSTGPLTVDFNGDGLALVQSWINTPSVNHGVIITNPGTSDGADFHASESSTAMARPKLEITYRVPATPSNEDPVAGFSHGCTDLDCSFTDTSTDSDGSVVSWSWDFGDGNGSSSQNPSHSFAAAGSYTVSLTVTDDDGASDNTSTLVTVSEPPPPNQAPTASFTHGCTDLDCGFTDTSTDSDGSVVSWSWDFGDGNGSSSQNPSHAFAAAGSYTVSLTVTDDDGDSDNTNTLVTVTAPPAVVDQYAQSSGTQEGTASGSYTDTHADDGVVQSITERLSNGKPSKRRTSLQHSWTFNVVSGTSVNLFANTWISGPADVDNYTFSYSVNGSGFSNLFTVSSTSSANVETASLPPGTSGTVTIRVVDSDNSQGETVQGELSVDELVIRTNTTPVTPPDASFTHSCTDLDCTFTDTSTDGDGSVVAWSWDFGDGNSSTAQNPNHGFAASGTYAVELTVTDNDGASDSASVNVTVTGTPPPNLPPTAAFTHGCTNLDCNFTDTSTDSDGSVVSWSWNFGDGNTSTAQNPSHSYAAAGTYTVSLTVNDDDGASDSTNAGVTVTDPPGGWTQLTFDDFESGWGNWADGGNDARLSSNNAIGLQAMNLRDDSSSSYSELSGSLDLSGYTQLQIEFSYVVQSFEGSEDFWVRFSDDGGSSWQTIRAFVNDVDFVDNGTRYDPVLVIDSGSYTFNSNVKIRFQSDASANNDNVYFDNIRISAQ